MDDLWARWRAFYEEHGIRASQICVDGIVDPARFAAAPKRILFVLREVNDWPGGDLRPFLAAGPRYQTWHNVARWAAGLLDGWPPYDVVDRFDRMHDALRQIAAINLKKTTGGSVADLSVVNAFAAHDRELLVEQIERIGPQIIVACGTFDQLVWLLDLTFNPDDPWRGTAQDAARGITVVPCRHPVRCNGARVYKELMEKFAAGRGDRGSMDEGVRGS